MIMSPLNLVPRAFPLKNGWSPLSGLFTLYWKVIFQQRKRENSGSFYTFTGKIERLETLRLRFFDISREPRTSRSHVTRAFPSGLRFKVHVCTPRPRSMGKWFTARFFCTLKHQNPTFEKTYNFLELFCLLIMKFSFKKREFWRQYLG